VRGNSHGAGKPKRVPRRLDFIQDRRLKAALYKKYYGWRLSSFQRYNFWVELLVAIGATGSGSIAGLAIFGTLPGKYAWLLVSSAAAVIAVVKPVLQHTKKIENYSKLFSGYSIADAELDSVIEDIRASGVVSDALLKRYESVKNSVMKLGADDDPNPDEQMIEHFREVVAKEYPTESLPTLEPAPAKPAAQSKPSTLTPWKPNPPTSPGAVEPQAHPAVLRPWTPKPNPPSGP
jgi:hypothetical protein